jgi:hypothetical protein
MAFDWSRAGATVDRVAVRTFDHGGGDPDRQPLYQSRLNGANDGAAFRLPAVFDAGYQQVTPDSGVSVGGIEPTLDVHFGDFPAGHAPRADDRVVIPTGPAAGTYKVVEVRPNEDQTGAVLPLKRVGGVP